LKSTRIFLTVGAVLAVVGAALGADDAHGDPELIRTDMGAIIGNFAVTLIVFVAVIVILGKFAWNPLLRVLNERERTIRESLETAQQQREQAERLMAEYQAQLNKAREEATAIVEEGRRDAEEVRRRMQEEAKAETSEMIARARREIQLATDTAVKDLYDRTADLVVTVAGEVIRKELSADDHRAFVRDSLSKMQESGKARMN
jgi:F-type H+-transporting ATPase subunit b